MNNLNKGIVTVTVHTKKQFRDGERISAHYLNFDGELRDCGQDSEGGINPLPDEQFGSNALEALGRELDLALYCLTTGPTAQLQFSEDHREVIARQVAGCPYVILYQYWLYDRQTGEPASTVGSVTNVRIEIDLDTANEAKAREMETEIRARLQNTYAD